MSAEETRAFLRDRIDRSQYGEADHRLRQHLSICLSNALAAAKEIHIVMAQMDPEHANQIILVKALHNVLIIAEQCRQGWLDKVPRPKIGDEE